MCICMTHRFTRDLRFNGLPRPFFLALSLLPSSRLRIGEEGKGRERGKGRRTTGGARETREIVVISRPRAMMEPRRLGLKLGNEIADPGRGGRRGGGHVL